MKRRIPDHRIDAAVSFCRDNILNDGAEGEMVHLLCDAVEQFRADYESYKKAVAENLHLTALSVLRDE